MTSDDINAVSPATGLALSANSTATKATPMAPAVIQERSHEPCAGSVLMSLVVLAYVTLGGLRGTAWANTFQTLVFMILGAVTFFVIVSKLGGMEAALARVSEVVPELLVRGDRIGKLEASP